MRSYKLLLIIAIALFFQNSQAQDILIKGKLIDAVTQAPVPAATIKVESKATSTVSSAQGIFSITASSTDILLITSVGYTPFRFSVNGQTEITIQLQPSITDLNEIVLVGTRSAGRIKTESTVPVDVIRIDQLSETSARMDLTSVLNYAAPSFNYNKQSGADGADHIDLGTLRGLGPDQTLVLINGKRRHQTAFVTLFGTRGRGNSGADLNAFPEAAVDRIEILRDGASAQYGSDAIAGVINIILKKGPSDWVLNAGYSGYYDSKFNPHKISKSNEYYTGSAIDGNTFTFSANKGFALGQNGGFINLSFDFLTQGKTFRQVLDTNVKSNPNALPLNTLRRAFGDGSLTTAGGMYNLELPIGHSGKSTFYSFGGYNYKFSDAYAYTRNQDTSSGNNSRFPLDINGNIIYDPRIMHKNSGGLIYYNPHIQTHIVDESFAAGIRGDLGNDWNYDLSNTLGRNDFHYFGDKTYNASIVGSISQNHFDDGGFNFLQNTSNLDLLKSFKHFAQGFNLGVGAEFRYERYSIYQGEEASWQLYNNSTQQAAGAQGFLGFRPADAIIASRTNIGGYIDGELNVTKSWLVDAAVRFENYSDFGFVNTYKLAMRLKVAPTFNLRGSISTGYRAPSLQQINFANTLTNYVGTVLEDEKVARNNDPITKAAGIPSLKQETSLNSSIGFAWKPVHGLTITVDGYMVKVKDRIVLSGLFSSSDTTLPVALTSALQSMNVALAQFFDNAVNTTNTGIDIVFDYSKNWGTKNFKALLAGNFQHMTIDAIHVPDKLNDSYVHRKTFFSDREEAFLKASAPNAKFSLNLEYGFHKFSIGTHITYFGKITTLGFGYTGLASAAGTGGPGDPNISGSFTGIDPYVDIDGYSDQVHVAPEVFNFKPKVVTDIYATYKFSRSITGFIGVDNLFNVHPDFGVVPGARYESFDNESGGAWDSVQMGFNGMRMFGKVSVRF